MATLRDFISLTLSFPLQLFAAFVSGILSTLLLTIQPVFIKTFINESARGVEASHLKALLLFMGLSLALAFIFDTIKVSMETVLKLKIENELRTGFHYFFSGCSKEKYDFAVRRGLFSMANFSFLLSFSLPMALVNIIVILIFIGFESPIMGLVTFLLCLASFFLNYYVSKELGSISKYKEDVKTSMIKTQAQNQQNHNSLVGELQAKEGSRFLWSTLLFLNQYSLFKIVPLVILLVLLSGNDLNSGSIAGLFLYFGLLIRPYQLLSLALQDLLVLYHQNEFIREEARLCMPLKTLQAKVPFGVVKIQGSNINEELAPINHGETTFYFNENTGESPKTTDFIYDLSSKKLELAIGKF